MNDDIKLNCQIKGDGWSNFLTGLGTAADKRKYNKSTNNTIITDDELEAIYADDGLGARIVDLLPEDMMKKGWTLEFENQDDDRVTPYNAILDAMHAREKIAEAFKWARLYGGAIIIIGAFDGQNLDQPLNTKSIKSVESLNVVPRPNIEYQQIEFQNNPNLPRFGEVEFYPVNFKINNEYKVYRIHHSRVIELHGIRLPYTGKSNVPVEYRYWGIPVLQRVSEKLSDLMSSVGGLATLMQEVSVGKYKFNDLAEILSAPDGDRLIKNRVEAMDLSKSVFHSIFLDSLDDFSRETLSFGGVSDVLNLIMTLISASTGYPMTRLFGISPSGLNSTGDSDTYSYYDMVEAKQNLELKPILHRLISLISEWQKLEMPEIKINPIEQMTEKEQAELEERKANTEKIRMETYQGYIDMGIMEPYQVEELEFGDRLKDIAAPEGYSLPPVTEGEGEE